MLLLMGIGVYSRYTFSTTRAIETLYFLLNSIFEMRRKKGFEYGTGKYYLTILESSSNITLFRSSREEAVKTYQHYRALGKTVEWHGLWNGKTFTDEKVAEPSLEKH